MRDGLQVQVLGPVVITGGGAEITLRRPLERGLLVRLALARGVGVPDERLTDDLWDGPDDQSRLARLRVVVSRLRGNLGPHGDAVVRGEGGYRLAADVPDLRAATAAAERLHTANRAADPAGVRRAAAEAAGQWRGPALADLRTLPFGRGEGERLDAWRLELTVHRLRADLTLGGAELVDELNALTAQNPLHEPLRGMFATALYRAGRQAEALAALAALRKLLADELGVDPTADTADLELRLLRHDPGLLVAAPTPPPPRPRTRATDLGPVLDGGLVGRRAELTELAGGLDAALAGRPTIVLVEGGPGLGRTRMLEALEQLAEQHGAAACWGRGTAEDGVPAFWPWRQALRQWKAATDPATAASVIGRAASGLGRIVPELGLPDIGRDQTTDRFALFEQVAEFLTGAASAGPGLVLLLDDLHLADVASSLLLAHVARSASASRLLIAASVRPTELRRDPRSAAAVADLVRQKATRRIVLTGLPTAAVGEQLARVLGRDCAPEVAEAVAHRTGGSPLFVQEIGRMMAGGDPTGAAIPPAVRDAVRQRLASTSPDGLAVLSAAAVLSAEVDASVVAGVVGRPVVDVLDLLDEAEAAAFLVRGERVGRFRFAHDIVREAVGLDVSAGDRARMHLRAAEHLETTGADEPLVAHHRLEALPLGDRDRAVRAATAAADLAMHQLAFEEAGTWYQRAIDAGATLGAAARAELLLRRAEAQHLGHDVAGAVRAGEEVAALAEHLDDPVLLGRAALLFPEMGDPAWLTTTNRWCRTALAALPEEDSALRARLMAQLAVSSVWDDDARTELHGVAALEMAERVGDVSAQISALRARQLARSGPDGVHERLRFGERMLELAGSAGDDAALWGHLWRFDALVQLGRVDDADIELDLLEPVTTRMRQPLPVWHLVRSRAALLHARGRLTEAHAAGEEAMRIALDGGHKSAEYPAHALRLALRAFTGDPIDPVVFEVERYQPPPRLLSVLAAEWHIARGDLEGARQIFVRQARPETVTLRPFMHLIFHAVNGSAAAALGDLPAAEHAYAHLRPHADLHAVAGAGASLTLGSNHLPLGTIAAALGLVDEAVDHLRAAAAANTAAGLTPYAALARHRLAAQLRRRARPGDEEEAATVSAEASSTAERLGMQLW